MPYKESDMQKAQVVYLTDRRNIVRDLMFCAIPNDSQMKTSRGKQNFRLSQFLRDMGLVTGAPDLLVWMRGRLLHIENKVKGRTQSISQEGFEAGLTALGYEYHVITAETPADAVTQLVALLDA